LAPSGMISGEVGTVFNNSIDELGPTSHDCGSHSARASHCPWSSGWDVDVLRREELCHAHTMASGHADSSSRQRFLCKVEARAREAEASRRLKSALRSRWLGQADLAELRRTSVRCSLLCKQCHISVHILATKLIASLRCGLVICPTRKEAVHVLHEQGITTSVCTGSLQCTERRVSTHLHDDSSMIPAHSQLHKGSSQGCSMSEIDSSTTVKGTCS
jgi:hypothetical protein